MNTPDVTEQPKAPTPAACSDWLADFASDNMPMDAGARRAHFESAKHYNAFHDGAMTPEIEAAIARARDKVLKAIKSRKSANDKLSHRPPTT